MKQFLLLIGLFFVTSISSFAQDDDDGQDNAKVRDKMNEYIQERLNLSADEAKKFSPVFLKYFKEWRTTVRENKGDKLVMRQKITDLQLRYRAQFREIIGEKRGSQVFIHQEGFIKGVRDLRNNGDRPLRRNRPN